MAADLRPLQTFEEQVISVDLEPGRTEEVRGQKSEDVHESALLLSSGVASAQGLDYVPGRIILGLTSETNIQEATTLVESLGGSVIKDLSSINAVVVELPDPDADMAEAIGQWMNQPGVQYAQPDYIEYVNTVLPNDAFFSGQWALHNTGQTGGTPDADIDAPEAWDSFTGGSDVVLATIDTGVNYSHPDLNMWTNPGEIAGNGIDDDGNGYADDVHGIDAYNGDSDPMDDHPFRHGTVVSGVMAAVGNNSIRTSGVNWDAQVMALKFQNRFGVGLTSTAIECIEYMTMMKRDYGVNVVVANTSWGGNSSDPALLAALEAAINEGIMFVAAAGNYPRDIDATPFYPASHDLDGIIAVAATDHNDLLTYFSNWGADSVDLGAPGEGILSINLFPEDGTSMAAPHVAGAVAFLKAFSPGSSLAQIKAAILAGTDKIPALNGITVSGGRLNLLGALMSLRTEVTVSAVPPSAAEDGGLLGFVFSRSGDTGAPLTANFTVAGSATFSSDYTQTGAASFAASSGTIIIPAGSSTATVTVDPTADTTVEPDETVVLTVATGTGYIVGAANSATGMIQNDDLATISINDVSLAEGNTGTTAFSFTVSIDKPASHDITVKANTSGVTATSGGTDYTDLVNHTATIAAGTTSTTVTVDVTGELVVEPDETFEVNLSDAEFNGTTDSTRVVIGDAQGTGTIQNDDLATISINDVSLAEGNTGTTAFSFTVSIDKPASHDITVKANTSGVAAISGGTDYVDLVNHAATIVAGTTSTTVTVDVTGELVVESNETFAVNLSDAKFNGVTDPARVVIGDAQGVGTIQNDDTSALTLVSVLATRSEGTGATTTAFGFSVTLDNPVQGGLSLAYATNDNTATVADNDYVDNDGTLTFAGTAGESHSITVLVKHDAKVEADELFNVALGAISGLAAGVDVNDITTTDTPQVGRIINDDTATLTVADVAKPEESAYLRFSVTLSHDVQGGLTVQKQSSDGTATLADNDYQHMLGTLSFTGYAGETHGFKVRITPDSRVEADETLMISLKNVLTLDAGVDAININATDTAIGTILNDDTAVLSIIDMAQAEDNGPMTFTVMLSHAVQGGLAVDYQTTDGSATIGDNDYNSATGPLSFTGLAGEIHTFTVDIIADGQVEFDEVFTVSLSNVQALGAGVDPADIDATDTAQGMIIRDDGNDITDLVSIHEVQVMYDNATRQKTVDVIIMNRGGRTLYRPLKLVVEVDDIDRSVVSLGNGDGHTFDGKSYVDITGLTGDGCMDAGELVRVRLVFDNGAIHFFGYALSLRGMLADQAPPADMEAPQVTIDPLKTASTTPRLTGTVDDPTATIEFVVDGRQYLGINRGDGTWSSNSAIHPSLTPGIYDVDVSATDAAGNAGHDNTVNELSIEEPIPPRIQVDHPASLHVVKVEHNYETGQLIVDVLVMNRAGHTIPGPVPLILEEVALPIMTLANKDGHTQDGKAYVDITQESDNGELSPGDLVRVQLVFDNALGASFHCRLGLRTGLNADSEIVIDREILSGQTPARLTTAMPPEPTKASKVAGKINDPVVAPAVDLDSENQGEANPDVLANEPTQPPEPVSVDGLISGDIRHRHYRRQTGQVTVAAPKANHSAQAIRGPLHLTAEQASSPTAPSVYAHSHVSNGLDGLDLTSSLDDARFRPERSLLASFTFNNAARRFFRFKPGIRGVLDLEKDDNWHWYEV